MSQPTPLQSSLAFRKRAFVATLGAALGTVVSDKAIKSAGDAYERIQQKRLTKIANIRQALLAR